MIAYLYGKIIEKKAPVVVIDVGGIGYEVFVPLTIYPTLPDCEKECKLLILHVQKEDSQRLYGFNTYEEKDLFVMLTGVSGIGDKSVLKYLNFETAEYIRDAIASNNLDMIKKLPGLGQKTASKLLIELQGKVMPTNEDNEIFDNLAISGLVALGYTEKTAKMEIKKVVKPNVKMKSEDIISEVLKSK